MTDLQLRDYQTRTVTRYSDRIFLGEHFRSCISAPTGSGKTVIAAAMLRWPLRQVAMSYRRVILEQWARTLTNCGIPYGFRASGYPANPDAPIQLAMTQTELRRRGQTELHRADLLHVDEIHAQTGALYSEVFDDYYKQGASIIGYTATPSDIGSVVDDVYQVATVPALIEQGYLCQPRVFNCGQPDPRKLDLLKREDSGEFTAKSIDQVIRPGVLIGHVIPHLKRLNPDGRPFVLFAHSVAASLWWAQSMTFKGIPTAHIDANDVWVDGKLYESDAAKRREVFERLADGSLKGVSNRFVLREGWDCPVVGHVILCCPMGLRRTIVQACGRVLRPYGNREYAVIQDHCGSTLTHPALDSIVPWDWQSSSGMFEKIWLARMRAAAAREEAGEQPKEDEITEPIVCPKCMGQRFAGTVCPFCGYRYDRRCHSVLERDGTLKLMHGRAFPPRRVRPHPTDAQTWERLYWATVKNGNRTAEQAYCYYAYSHNWRWLPKNLPLMPRDEADFFIPLRDVPRDRLIPQNS